MQTYEMAMSFNCNVSSSLYGLLLIRFLLLETNALMLLFERLLQPNQNVLLTYVLKEVTTYLKWPDFVHG